MKKFSLLSSNRERMHFVDQMVPEDVTNISTIKDLLEEHEVEEEEEEEMLKSNVAEQLFTSHPRFPCLSEMVRVEYTPERGRHLRAARALQIGEVVAVEEAVAHFPVTRDLLEYCAHCTKTLVTKVICPSCRQLNFCSQVCLQRASATHHKYECRLGLIPLLQQAHPGLGKLFMVLRVFTQKSASWFLEHGQKLLEHHPEQGSGLGDKLITDYFTLFNLARHDPTDPAALLEVSLVSLLMVRMLARVNYFARGDVGRQQQEMVGELASILISVVNVNTHPVHDMTSDQQSKTICAAVYPVVASLFNHSCEPSLVRASWGSRLVLAAGREVEEGEELTDMYTVHWTEYTLEERREYLDRVFHFFCKCHACCNGWEPPEDLDEDTWSSELNERFSRHRARSRIEENLLLLLNKLT